MNERGNALLLGATLAAPFLLRPDDGGGAAGTGKSEELVVITPHTESIRAEFERAFIRHMRENHQREVTLDWRIPGGTSDISRFLKSFKPLRECADQPAVKPFR